MFFACVEDQSWIARKNADSLGNLYCKPKVLYFNRSYWGHAQGKEEICPYYYAEHMSTISVDADNYPNMLISFFF